MRANKPQSAVASQRHKLNAIKNNNFMGPNGGVTNISALVKKFKKENSVPQSLKNELQVTHMARNTLLEPNNFIPHWESGGEEKKEVSTTLKALRQKYDIIHKKVQAKQDHLEDLKRQLEKAAEEEIFLSEVNENKKGTADSTKEELEALVEEHEFEKMTQCQYNHMIRRMKADLVSSQLRSQELKDSMKSKEEIVKEESEKVRKAKQERILAKMRLEQVMMKIDQEQREREERISSM